MNPKTEEFLNILLWSAVAQQQLLERDTTAPDDRLYRLTAQERELLGGGKINVESLILLEARPCAGESDAEIVAGAWDFERVNRRYARHLPCPISRAQGISLVATSSTSDGFTFSPTDCAL